MNTPAPHVLLGITGGIAAYKSASLVRRLRERGAEVQVVMTPGAQAFITPLTLQAVSGRPVRTDLLDPEAEAGMGHIELARWADLVLVAPASADFIARLTAGMADDLLSTVCLATEAPIHLAPAMNRVMWSQQITQENCQRLRQRGVRLWGPGRGDQACGEDGEGRMLEPESLAGDVLEQHRAQGEASSDHHPVLQGRWILITAGPTYEDLDPVRYLGNRSSGRMGFALAATAARLGAEVTLVAGPTELVTPEAVRRIDVRSALEMYDAVQARVAETEVFIGVAAVADYRPATMSQQKIKKTDDSGAAKALQIELVANPDILAAVAAASPRPFCVGFAAETEDLEAQARRKLEAKGLDLIAANRVDEGRGFAVQDNELLVLAADGRQWSLGPAHKQRLAEELMRIIAGRLDDTRALAETAGE